MSGYDALANAIIIQAVQDYRSAQIKLRKEPDNDAAAKTLQEIEAFFQSKWFGLLSELNGEKLLQKLKEGRF